jgi:hypothetical protein
MLTFSPSEIGSTAHHLPILADTNCIVNCIVIVQSAVIVCPFDGAISELAGENWTVA